MQTLSKYSSGLIEFGVFTPVAEAFNKDLLRFDKHGDLNCNGMRCQDCPLDDFGACVNLYDEPPKKLLNEFATITKTSHLEYFI